jgi:hypothetical protein
MTISMRSTSILFTSIQECMHITASASYPENSMPTENHRTERDSKSYFAYLVRLWKDGQPAIWRASAQSAQTGEIARFATLYELFAFLAAQTEEIEDDDAGPAISE